MTEKTEMVTETLMDREQQAREKAKKDKRESMKNRPKKPKK